MQICPVYTIATNYIFRTDSELMSNYTTVDDTHLPGRFDLKFFVNCLIIV